MDPIRGLYCAVTRQTIEGEPAGGWVPEQKVDIETALRAYTVMGAYSSFEEKVKGQLKAGMRADVIVFSQDLFRVPVREIYKARVTLTVVGGRVVSRAE